MARTKTSKSAKSAASNNAASGRKTRPEGARREPAETPESRINPKTKSAAARQPTSKSKNKTKAKTKPNANAITETEPKVRTKATGRKSSESAQPEPRVRSAERKLAPALSQKRNGRKPETDEHVLADVSTLALFEPEVLDQFDLPRSLLEPSAVGRKPETDEHVLADVSTLALFEPEVLDQLDLPGSSLEPRDKVARSEKEETIFRNLKQALEAFTSVQELGQVTGDAEFDWPETNGLDLRPDLAFVSFDRWARSCPVPKNHVWHVVPDLVVEIIRSSEQTEKRSDWLEAYFRSGVNRVWIVYPEQLKIHDHDSLASSRVLGRDDVIDGRAILPGFQLPVKELLAE